MRIDGSQTIPERPIPMAPETSQQVRVTARMGSRPRAYSIRAVALKNSRSSVAACAEAEGSWDCTRDAREYTWY